MKAQIKHATMYGTGEKLGDSLYLWCPGCDAAGWGGLHSVTIAGTEGAREPAWSWDGNLGRPTLSPSLLIRYGLDGKVCHSFVRDGRWEFLGDSTHPLAGQTVELPELPGWLVSE